MATFDAENAENRPKRQLEYLANSWYRQRNQYHILRFSGHLWYLALDVARDAITVFYSDLKTLPRWARVRSRGLLYTSGNRLRLVSTPFSSSLCTQTNVQLLPVLLDIPLLWRLTNLTHWKKEEQPPLPPEMLPSIKHSQFIPSNTADFYGKEELSDAVRAAFEAVSLQGNSGDLLTEEDNVFTVAIEICCLEEEVHPIPDSFAGCGQKAAESGPKSLDVVNDDGTLDIQLANKYPWTIGESKRLPLHGAWAEKNHKDADRH
ncbi:hypothetical protein B0H19DRAFT_1058639 [Mycena capillaripes]|nr:hypothetical protein B0H19DRAFT_1058639 [Mycena capillaripes]